MLIFLVSILLITKSSCENICGLNYRLTNGGSDRIIGGIDANPDEFPWMVSIQMYNHTHDFWYHNCGGAILSPQIILTAAHCQPKAGQLRRRFVRVVAGCHWISDEDSRCQVIPIGLDDFMSHHRFMREGRGSQMDIAVIQLREAFRFTNKARGAVGPICLPNPHIHDPVVGERVIAAGWGLNGDPKNRHQYKHKIRISDSLKKTILEIYHPDICDRGNKDFNRDKQLCLGSSGTLSNREDTCGGDSGGPVMKIVNNRYYVVGIVSRGPPCGQGSPSIYTRVSAFHQWIDNMTPKRFY